MTGCQRCAEGGKQDAHIFVSAIDTLNNCRFLLRVVYKRQIWVFIAQDIDNQHVLRESFAYYVAARQLQLLTVKENLKSSPFFRRGYL
jgi:hypothetical protein